jgi:hypothetical protein
MSREQVFTGDVTDERLHGISVDEVVGAHRDGNKISIRYKKKSKFYRIVNSVFFGQIMVFIAFVWAAVTLVIVFM